MFLSSRAKRGDPATKRIPYCDWIASPFFSWAGSSLTMITKPSLDVYDHSLLSMKEHKSIHDSRLTIHDHLISIDYGTHKSWLAYSVEGFCFAHKTLPTKELIEYIKTWISERKAEKVIIGLPLNIDGTESKHSKKVRSFAKILEREITIPIVFHDERLTTSEATLWLEWYDNGDIDAESARLILEDYLKKSD